MGAVNVNLKQEPQVTVMQVVVVCNLRVTAIISDFIISLKYSFSILHLTTISEDFPI